VQTAVSGSWDHTARIWDASTSQATHILQEHTNWVTCVSQIDNNMIATASNDSTVRLWDVRTGENVRVLRGLKGRINAICYVDGRLIVGAEQGPIIIWNTTSYGSCHC